MARYSTLYKLQGNLYDEGSPVLIVAGALLKDNQIGRVLGQLKFRNLVGKEIRALKVGLRAYDVSGDEIEGVGEFQYLDLAAARGDEFGDRKAIALPNPVARSFSVYVQSVLFSDGSAWKAKYDDPWIPLPHLVHLSDALGSAELAEQYARETTEKSHFAPLELDDLWYCACGGINKDDETFCPACGAERAQIFAAMDEERLKKNYKKWSAQQNMDSSAEELHTKKKKSGLMKALLILLPILLVIAAGVFAVSRFVLPMLAYERAEEKLALQDFDGAIESFTALGDYKDSPERIIAARYAAAIDMLDKEQIDSAREAFEKLGRYKDSAQRVLQCDYIAAEKLLNAKKYDEAREAFLALGDYEDADDRAVEALYLKAAALRDEGKTKEAMEIFKQLGGYSDSVNQLSALKQAEIDQINRYIRQNKFEEAWDAYKQLEDYKPDALSREDFVNPDGDMCEYLDENTTGEKFFGIYRYMGNGYDSRKDVTVTARDIRLTDSRIAVYMAYGEPDETGVLITDGGFYTQINEESQAAMLEECDHYVRYSYNNYRLYFYFDSEDKVSWIIFSNEDYFCSTPDPVEETEEQTA